MDPLYNPLHNRIIKFIDKFYFFIDYIDETDEYEYIKECHSYEIIKNENIIVINGYQETSYYNYCIYMKLLYSYIDFLDRYEWEYKKKALKMKKQFDDLLFDILKYNYNNIKMFITYETFYDRMIFDYFRINGFFCSLERINPERLIGKSNYYFNVSFAEEIYKEHMKLRWAWLGVIHKNCPHN